MKIALTGSSGLIGKRLKSEFAEREWEIVTLGRNELYEGGQKLAEKISGCHAVIHLAGAPIIKRWTKKYKNEIFDSRIITTRNLAQAILASDAPPEVFISVSAVGIYDDTQIQTEKNSAFAADFLGNLCRQWEEAALSAKDKCRVVIFRLGIVLDKNGGALKKMLLPFRTGLGGKTGSGRQMISWVHIEDVESAFIFALQNPLEGIFNLTAPESVSNSEFSQVLAKALNTRSRFSVPGFILKLLYGEGASVLLKGQIAVPERLLHSGFEFKYPTIEKALDDLLNQKK